MSKKVCKSEVLSVESLTSLRYFTYPEVAEILRCNVRTVHNRVRNGDLVPYRNGRLVLFTEQCIEEFLQRQYKTSN
jgi:excisionase family DNA binding protein